MSDSDKSKDETRGNGGGGFQSLKKRLCNPPGVRVAECGDPEVMGLFEGAGEGLVFGLDYIGYVEEDANLKQAFHDFEKEVVKVESYYIKARKRLAQETVDRMKTAIDALVLATGGEVYGGG